MLRDGPSQRLLAKSDFVVLWPGYVPMQYATIIGNVAMGTKASAPTVAMTCIVMAWYAGPTVGLPYVIPALTIESRNVVGAE